MSIDFIFDIIRNNKEKEAIIWNDQVYSFGWVLSKIEEYRILIDRNRIEGGSVVALVGDFTPSSIALLITLIEKNIIILPLINDTLINNPEYLTLAECEFIIHLTADDAAEIEQTGRTATHKLFKILRSNKNPGLILFSSGSEGLSKAAVHDFSRLLQKYKQKRHDLKSITFLLFDHIGGIDTLFYSLSNASCIITVQDRQPDAICEIIQKYEVEVLPVTPTFLNLLMLSKAYTRYDLSSLKYITYGTEPMTPSTLKNCSQIFPSVKIIQKYGTTEVGTLRSKSKSSDSTWVKIGGEGYETRIVDNMLQIKAKSAMLGYLNAPSPFTEDGWFITGDEVEQNGEYIKILGRRSDLINVGGEKVYPAEIENVIQEMDNVAEVVIYSEPSPIIGNMVCAKVQLVKDADQTEFTVELKNYCKNRLSAYKIPVKVIIDSHIRHSARFKKIRPNK